MGLGVDYINYVRKNLRMIEEREMRSIERAADRAVETILSGFTCYHMDIGHMPGNETAPGRAARPPIFTPISGDPNAAQRLRRGDLLVLGDQFDAGVVEMALRAREKGVTVVIIGAKSDRAEVPARHATGKTSSEVADIWIETYVPLGDGAMIVEGLEVGACATSGITNSAVYWALCGEIAERLAKARKTRRA